jgi:hypothetical protein
MPIERDAHRIALVVRRLRARPRSASAKRAPVFPTKEIPQALLVVLPMYASQSTIHTVVPLQRTTVMPRQSSKQYCVSRRAGYGFSDLIAAWPGEIATECVVKASRKTAGRN